MRRIVLTSTLIILGFLNVQAQDNPWAIKSELSYVRTTGNSSSETASIKLDVNRNGEKNRYIFQTMFLTASSDDKKTANKLMSEFRYERVFSGRIFGFMDAVYLRDTFAGYEHRFSLGPGVGIDMLNNEKHVLKSLLSGHYAHEDYTVDSLGTKGFATIKVALNHEWKITDNTTLKTGADYAMSMENKEQYYFNGETSLSVGISSRISIGLSYLINYRNLVPSPDIKSTDTSFLASIILNLSSGE